MYYSTDGSNFSLLSNYNVPDSINGLKYLYDSNWVMTTGAPYTNQSEFLYSSNDLDMEVWRGDNSHYGFTRNG